MIDYMTLLHKPLFWMGSVSMLAAGAYHLFHRPGLGFPYAADKYGSHGTSRWASGKETSKAYVGSGPGVVVSRFQLGKKQWKLRIIPYSGIPANRFSVIIGPSGSQKTRAFALPNLIHAALHDKSRSWLVTDPKGELYEHTADLFRKNGFDVKVFNLCDMDASDRYNPLTYVTNPEEAQRLAATIIANTDSPQSGGEAFWRNSEEAVLSCIIWYVKSHLPPEHQHPGTVQVLASAFGGDEVLMQRIFNALPLDDGAHMLYGSVRTLKDKTREGVFAGVTASRLKLWALKRIFDLTSGSDFDLRQLGHTPTILYCIIPDHHKTYKAITALFFDQAFQVLIEEAEKHGGKLPVEVRFLMEEMANIGRINDLDNRVATVRSRGIIVEMILQNLNQLRTTYGDSWVSIMGNSGNLIVLAVNDSETAEYVSKQLGTTTIRTTSQSKTSATKGGSEGTNQSFSGRPLMFPEEVQGRTDAGLDDGDLVMLRRSSPPAKMRKCPISDADGWVFPGAENLILLDPAQYTPSPRPNITVVDPYSLIPPPPPPSPGPGSGSGFVPPPGPAGTPPMVPFVQPSWAQKP